MVVTRSRTDRESGLRFDALYRAYHPEVLAYFIRRMSRSEAEDAAAEVFTIAWRRIDRVPEGDREVGWLYVVAHNVLSNQRRSWRRALRLSRRLGGLAPPAQSGPEPSVVRSTTDQLLMNALNHLRWSDREILRLAAWERLSYDTIGELLGITEAAVGQRISRARGRLGKELARTEARRSAPVPPSRRKDGWDE